MPSQATTALLLVLLITTVVLAVAVWRLKSSRRLAFLREAALVLGAYAVYFTLRGTTEGHIDTARANARLVMEFQKQLGIFVEPMLQEAILAYDWIVALLNWVYTWGHWPVIAGVAIWLYRSRQSDYRLFRNAFLISGGIGLICFTLFPVAPPRLAGMGMMDTLTAYSTSFQVLQPASLVNEYAAMPSLHFGWNLLVAIAIARHLPTRAMRPVVVLLLPAIMLSSIVLTANHFIADAVAGGIVALASLAIAAWIPPRERLIDALRGWEPLRSRLPESRLDEA